MPVEYVGVIGVVVMFVLMFLRVPIAVAMAVPGIAGAYYLRGWTPTETMLNTVIWNHAASFTLTTIPMFILMGQLIYVSGISTELFDLARKWVGSIKGGLAVATIGASAIFAAASGSSLASTGTMGVIAYNEMKESGYDDAFSSAAIVAGGTLGILIPPSTAFIIYGIIAEQSIGKLLLAGILPGILLTALYTVTAYMWAVLRPDVAPEHGVIRVSWRERFMALRSVFWIVLLFVLVIGGMYLGIFSPTEAAGVGAFGALIISITRRKLTWANFHSALISTLKTTGFIFAIIMGAFILNYFLALTRLPILLANVVSSSAVPPVVVLLLILLLYTFLGAVMDALAMVVITIPIILPVVESLGFDLIWFGVIIVIMIELALITPPVGMNCYVLNGVVPSLRLEDIFRGALRFVVPIWVLVGILIAFPDIALIIPMTMR